jgi:hypothetical protein
MMQTKDITAKKGPNGSVAVVLMDGQGRLISHLLRPTEAGNLAIALRALADEQGDIEKIATVG